MIESIEQGRKEDGNRSIADKIKSRLHDLEQTIESNLGRWAWELLQNAKDSISDEDDRDVDVEIELNEDSVVFKHNGAFFTDLDIRGLINQISSKEVEEGEQTRNTGRFGTGFLTTHMLSRKVEVSGIVKTEKEGFHSFNFLLDREGKTTKELAPKVEFSWKGFQESTKQIDHDYDENSFNTSFCYLLDTADQKEVANKGIVEFSKLVPYVLTFIPKIKRVSIFDNLVGYSVLYENTGEIIDDVISKIEKTENSVASSIFILQASNDKTSIAIEVEPKDGGYSVRDIKDIPKLFCDFPLIGSENFHLPMVINSFYFHPLTERDGIWLKNETSDEVQENRSLLENSIKLYQELIEQVSEKNFFDLYNLATTKSPTSGDKFFDRNWFTESIQTPLREFLKTAKIVETNSGKASIEEVYFPDTNLLKDDREKIWQLSSDLKVNKLPIKDHIQKWATVIWSDCSKVDINDLVNDLSGKKSLSKLVETLEVEEAQALEWLNICLEFIHEKDTLSFGSYEIIPNQAGDFKAANNLSLDEIEDEKLKEISKLVGHNFYEELVHLGVFLGQHTRKKNIHDIASKISHLIGDENQSQDRNMAISMLIEWFENNPDVGKEYFNELYGKKEKLLVDTIDDKDSLFLILNSNVDIADVADLVKQVTRNPDKIKESINKAKQFDDLLAEYGAANIEELKRLIVAKGVSTLLPIEPVVPKVKITQETLASLGVTTPEELKVALKDETISEQFFHESTPSQKMFRYAQEIIERAKNNILAYLQEHPDYDCNDVEELATTIFGVAKHGQPITIVVRPSDNGQVIIYYDSEKASLEYEDAVELWVEDGKSPPMHLTLGKVLKSTKITKIPLCT